jgi:23S rRNA (cytidine1920-2'-O)/16S rRNA (cytidine1409-2'-O)-methyltransferase
MKDLPGQREANAKKERLDILLVDRGLVESREKAQGQIMAGVVYAGGVRADKPGRRFPRDVAIEIRGSSLPYVSRGGLKLEAALGLFSIPVQGRTALDIGASTGGFVDCLIQRGAARVYAIDVGYGQLHQKIRSDPRVVAVERTNARYLTRTHVPEQVSLVTIDVSFISVKKVVPPARAVCSQDCDFVILVKPEFEAGRQYVRRGVVRSREVHARVVLDIWAFLAEQGLPVRGVASSPITGPEGNIEFWLHAAELSDRTLVVDREQAVTQVVDDAHARFCISG